MTSSAGIDPPTEDSPRNLLQELVFTYGPCGQEDAVRDVCRRELEPVVDRAWVDEAGNLVGLIRAVDGAGPDPHATAVMAHMDELSMLVERIDPDGTLDLTPLGTMHPANFGLGPVAILGDHRTVCGVLSLGSEHVSVFTGRPAEALAAAGIHPGTRVCVHESKRTLIDVGDYLGCYFMDDRAPVAALLQTARALYERGERPPHDVYVVFTASEEIGGVGGSYASRTLPANLVLALEVGPTEAEYDTTVGGGPIIGYGGALDSYDTDVADRLMEVATDLALGPQAAVLGAFETDASHAKANGLSARAGLLCVPTLSAHGYEVIHRDAISAVRDVLVEFLLHPGDAEVSRRRTGLRSSP